MILFTAIAVVVVYSIYTNVYIVILNFALNAIFDQIQALQVFNRRRLNVQMTFKTDHGNGRLY